MDQFSPAAPGRVYLAGRRHPVFSGSAELYDPATGTWSTAASMGVVRYHHAATALSDGWILVTGGYSTDTQASAELYGVP